MKIYTEVVFDMNATDSNGMIKEVSSKSYDYKGEIAECRTYRRKSEKTITLDSGAKLVYRTKQTKQNWAAQWNNAGYEIDIYNPQGEKIESKYFGQTESSGFRGSVSGYKDKLDDYIAEMTGKMNEEYGYKSLSELAEEKELAKEKAEMKLELSKKTKTAEQALKDQAEISGEITQRNVARQSSAQIAQVKNALLAQGYTPEEADAVVAKGVESGARTTADITSNIEMAKAKATGEIAQLDISNVKDAESLATKLKEISNTMILGKSNIANQLKMANISAAASRYGADRSLEGTKYTANMQAVGDIAESVGKAGGIMDFIFRRGGKVSKKLLETYKENK